MGPTSFANARDATSVSRSCGPRYFLSLAFKRKKSLSYQMLGDLPTGTLGYMTLESVQNSNAQFPSRKRSAQVCPSKGDPRSASPASVCPNPNFCNVITHNERNERDGDGRIGYLGGMEADAAREQTMTDQMGSRDETLNPMDLSNQSPHSKWVAELNDKC